jgi:hypothetical protein
MKNHDGSLLRMGLLCRVLQRACSGYHDYNLGALRKRGQNDLQDTYMANQITYVHVKPKIDLN